MFKPTHLNKKKKQKNAVSLTEIRLWFAFVGSIGSIEWIILEDLLINLALFGTKLSIEKKNNQNENKRTSSNKNLTETEVNWTSVFFLLNVYYVPRRCIVYGVL